MALVPSGNKPLPEPMLTKLYDILLVALGHIELIYTAKRNHLLYNTSLLHQNNNYWSEWGQSLLLPM